MFRYDARPYGLRNQSSDRFANSSAWLSTTLLVAVLTFGSFAPNARADEDEIPFDEAEIFFELNNTDGDLGIHALIDGDAWKKLRIRDPRGRKILDIKVAGRLKKQGLTEIFFESAEPTFEELLPEDFFDRFPEGTYEIAGATIEGEELESVTEVTHLMPAPPEPSVNGIPAAADCDAVLPVVSDPVTITWPAITMSHPELGRTGEMIEVVNYEVVVEIDETPFKTSTILPPHEMPGDVLSFQVPSEILSLNDMIKFEVLVREASFNQTAVESCFIVME